MCTLTLSLTKCAEWLAVESDEEADGLVEYLKEESGEFRMLSLLWGRCVYL